MTDEQTLLAAIIARPDDDLPRLVMADWLEETAGMVPCTVPTCGNPARGWDGFHRCRTCHGTGEVSNGHTERAEFIRVQCELAKWADHDPRPNEFTKTTCMDGHGNAIDGWELDALRRRERALLFDHGFKWGREVVPVPAGYKHTRGDDNDFHAWSNENLDGMRYSFRRGFVESLTCSWSDFRTHADAIRRATPLRKVRPTDRPPPLDFRRTSNPDLFTHLDYPGLVFELPLRRGISDEERAELFVGGDF